MKTEREAFEAWADFYALDSEPLDVKSRRDDCFAAWLDGWRAALSTKQSPSPTTEHYTLEQVKELLSLYEITYGSMFSMNTEEYQLLINLAINQRMELTGYLCTIEEDGTDMGAEIE